MEENFYDQKKPDNRNLNLTTWIKEYDNKFYNLIDNDEEGESENNNIILFPLSSYNKTRNNFYSKFLPRFSETINAKSSKKRNKYEDFFVSPSLPQKNNSQRTKLIKIDKIRRSMEKEKKLKNQKNGEKKLESKKQNVNNNKDKNKNIDERQTQPIGLKSNLVRKKYYKSKKK